MSDFFEKLRRDAVPLRFEPDGAMLSRIAARVRERTTQPTVAQLLAAWFRPLAASLGAVALAATIGLALWDRWNRTDEPQFASTSTEIMVAGSTYSVGE